MNSYVIGCLISLAIWAYPAPPQQQVQPVAGVLTLNLVPGTSSFKVILSASVTSVVIQNPTPGTIISVIFTENATGGFTVTFGGNISNPCAVTTTANATTICQFQYDSTNNQWTGVGGGAAGIANAINMQSAPYNVVADVRTCQGTNGVLTINSPNFTCTGANFCNGGSVACPTGQTVDVGKRFNATSGCCNLSIPFIANQVVPNNTTILSVQSSTAITLSQNATVTVSGQTTLFAWWGTDDDAAVSAADTAYINNPICTALIWPPTPFLVKNPHFNSPNPQCEQLEHSGVAGNRVATGSYVGWGSNDSVMYLDSSFPVTPCTGNAGGTFGAVGCFFSYAGVHAAHLGISGGWNNVPNGGGHNYVLVNAGMGADFIDVRTVGFSAGDGTTTGMAIQGASNLLDTYLAGFGFDGVNFNTGGSPTTVRGGEFSNVGGVCAKMAGTYPVVTHQISYGTCGGG